MGIRNLFRIESQFWEKLWRDKQVSKLHLFIAAFVNDVITIKPMQKKHAKVIFAANTEVHVRLVLLSKHCFCKRSAVVAWEASFPMQLLKCEYRNLITEMVLLNWNDLSAHRHFHSAVHNRQLKHRWRLWHAYMASLLVYSIIYREIGIVGNYNIVSRFLNICDFIKSV